MSAPASVMFPARGGLKGGIHVDTVLLSLVLGIVLLGLVMVTSASISVASREGLEPLAYLEKQFVLTLTGFAFAAVLFCIRPEVLERNSTVLLAVAAALLVIVLIPGLGHVVNGSRRWIRFAGMNFQASEAARVLVLIWVAGYALRRENELRTTFKGLMKPLGVLLAFAGLLLVEPDFGAATVLVVTGFALLFLAGAQLRWVLALTVGLAGLAALAVWVAPYRMQRLMTFLDPWADPFNKGYQLTHSLIAIGRGEWFGVGLGASVQKLFYLPEAHTDFLFAVLAEELGLVGVATTLLLFLGLVWRVLHISRLASEAGLRFHAYLAAGFALWVGTQAFINIGVNMGALPTKGLTLPLMSYGRSSLIVALAWLGIVFRVHHDAVSMRRGSATAQRTRRRAVEEDE